jgi:hypothetical protein
VKALSIQQPWCSAIAYGPKRIENRTWAAPQWALGTTIALHASKGPDWQAPEMAWTAAGISPYKPGAPRKHWEGSLPLGAIVAVAVVADCHFGGFEHPDCSPWGARDQFHWLLRDIRPLRDPVPARGMLGLWTVPEDTESAIRAQLGETR